MPPDGNVQCISVTVFHVLYIHNLLQYLPYMDRLTDGMTEPIALTLTQCGEIFNPCCMGSSGVKDSICQSVSRIEHNIITVDQSQIYTMCAIYIAVHMKTEHVLYSFLY